MKIYRYENAVCKTKPAFFKEDEYCFFVLKRILQGECRLTVTDNRRFIICHSCDPYPVWIWLRNNANKEEMALVYQIIKENFGLDGRYRFNTKYFFAAYMLERGRQETVNLQIVQNILAYHCPTPIEPQKKADGNAAIAELKDLEIATNFMEEFHNDIKIDQTSVEKYRQKARAMIEAGRLYFWVDKQSEKVAMCSYSVSDDKASVGSVYTRKDKRRMGYAAGLVYEVTKLIIAQEKKAMLYTDADYIPSNACYESVGYIKQGELCTLQ